MENRKRSQLLSLMGIHKNFNYYVCSLIFSNKSRGAPGGGGAGAIALTPSGKVGPVWEFSNFLSS